MISAIPPIYWYDPSLLMLLVHRWCLYQICCIALFFTQAHLIPLIGRCGRKLKAVFSFLSCWYCRFRLLFFGYPWNRRLCSLWCFGSGFKFWLFFLVLHALTCTFCMMFLLWPVSSFISLTHARLLVLCNWIWCFEFFVMARNFRISFLIPYLIFQLLGI